MNVAKKYGSFLPAFHTGTYQSDIENTLVKVKLCIIMFAFTQSKFKQFLVSKGNVSIIYSALMQIHYLGISFLASYT